MNKKIEILQELQTMLEEEIAHMFEQVQHNENQAGTATDCVSDLIEVERLVGKLLKLETSDKHEI